MSGIVGITESLRACEWPSMPKGITVPQGKVQYSSFLGRRDKYVDATETEIGTYAILEALLIDGIIGSQTQNLLIVPQFQPKGSSVDFSITVKKEAVSISSIT